MHHAADSRAARLARRLKAAGYSARAGETIAGNLARGGDGKFTSAGNAAAPAEKPDKPAPSRRSENARARRERQDAEAETRAQEDAEEQAKRDEEDAELDAAKTPRERNAIRQENARARRERARERRAARAERQAAERASRTQEDTAADADTAQRRAAPRPERAAKPRKGGGKGGGGKQDDPAKAAAQEQRAQERQARDAERRQRQAAADERRAAIDARRAEAEQRRQASEAQRQERTQRELTDLAQQAQTPGVRLTDTQWQRLIVEGLAERDGGTLRLTDAGRQQATRRPQATKGSVFAVFKDARGADRWISLTTTAYEDKDQEIITTTGIGRAVAYGDSTGERGVLRYWHCPGVDLGVCDFQAQAGPGGRWLVESGTFYGPVEARIGRAMAAKGWQMSPGFYHPQTEPYPVIVGGRRVGLYDNPIIFERSPTPPGRASNLFSRFTMAKENSMNEEKRAQLKELVGGDEALLSSLLAGIEQRDKAAQQSAVAYKDAPEWAQALISRIDALEDRLPAAEKAAMPPAEMVEAGATEVEDGEADAMEDAAEGEGADNLLSPAEIDAIAGAVAAKLMGELEGISAKMAAVDEELKGRGYTKMKESSEKTLPALVLMVKELKATVDELAGLAPAKGHRPSEDNPDIEALVEAALKAEGEDYDPSDPYAGVMKFLRPAA